VGFGWRIDRPADRPPSRASRIVAPPLPQEIGVRLSPFAPHHSSGRALARLQLLILIHPPLRQAEWRCSSGGQARSAVRRSRTHREEVEAKPTGGDAPRWTPERRNAEPKRGAGRWGETFWFLLWRLTKGTRRKGETLSRRYRRNGYVHHQQQHGRPKGRQGQKSPTASPKSKEEC